MANAPAAGVADVHRLAAHPSDKGVCNGPQVPTAAVDQRGAERKRHFGVIGDAPRLQAEPAATNDLVVDRVLRGNFPCRHEFDRGTQRIANGQPQEGPQGPVPKAGNPPASRMLGF